MQPRDRAPKRDDDHDPRDPDAASSAAPRDPALRILDGAYGTLLAPHVRGGETVEQLTLREPARVVAAHAAYLEAGATALQTNTFLAFALAGDRQRRDVLLAGLQLAREAAAMRVGPPAAAGRDPVDGGVEVLATLGPGGDARQLRGDLDLLLDRGEARTLLCETVTARTFALELLAAWRDVDGASAGATLTLSCSIDPADGAAARAWIRALAADAPDGVLLGLNCCAGPVSLAATLDELADATGGAPLHLAPSAGVPDPAASGPGDPPCWPWARPELWAEAVAEQLDGGAPIARVGGCCGTTPEHVAALVEALASGSTAPAASDEPA